MKGRKFGRKPAHRKALMINLCTSLIQHERITTTLAKAKEMRPHVERLIHKAKSGTPESNIILNAEIKNKAALNRLHNIIAPRFANLPAGFTRIEFTGKRRVDKSETAIIELIGNDQQEFEKNEDRVEKEDAGIKSFWEWESGLLDQEEKYWENQLRELKMQIDDEIRAREALEKVGLDDARRLEIRTDINNAHLKKKKFLMMGYQRTKDENELIQSQKEYRKYQKMYIQYAYPLNALKFKQGEFDDINKVL